MGGARGVLWAAKRRTKRSILIMRKVSFKSYNQSNFLCFGRACAHLILLLRVICTDEGSGSDKSCVCVCVCGAS